MKALLTFLSVGIIHLLFLLNISIKRKIPSGTSSLLIRIKTIKTQTTRRIGEESKSLKSLRSFSKMLRSNFNGTGYAKKINLKGEGSVVDDLYEKINEGLTFPMMYQKFGIQGVVEARLYFNKSGKFVMKSSLFKAKNGFLRYHVMTYLEKKLRNYELKSKNREGLVSMRFVFRYQVTPINLSHDKIIDQFVFERIGFQGETQLANALLEVGKTLVSLLNLLKYRPDFLKTNKELQKQQLEFWRLEKIRKHPYYQ